MPGAYREFKRRLYRRPERLERKSRRPLLGSGLRSPGLKVNEMEEGRKRLSIDKYEHKRPTA